MIITVTPNPCVDKTLSLPFFRPDETNRAELIRQDLGGKGINVSCALKGLGSDTLCTGFDFSDGGYTEEYLNGEGVRFDFIRKTGGLRVCSKFLIADTGTMIEINEKGSAVTGEEGEALLRKVVGLSRRADFLTLSGSLPAGLEKDFYRKILQAVKAEGGSCRTAVDADGELLRLSLEASPDFIKPNIFELQNAFGREIRDLTGLDELVREILAEYHIGMICVSMGEKGAYIGDLREAYFSAPAKVPVCSLQGAGDSMVAGILHAAEHRLPLPEMLRYGICASADSIRREGTQLCTADGVRELLAEVKAPERLR